jgi:hypothetical protein
MTKSIHPGTHINALEPTHQEPRYWKKESTQAIVKEAIVHPLPSITTEIRDGPIPTPGPDEVIIKVEVAGSNVKGLCLISSV